MSTITIDAVDYPVYADVTEADTYLAAAIHADSWATVVLLDKQRALVTATRILDRQKWAGAPTADPQDLAWPRTGLEDRNGNPLDEDTIPEEVQEASIELALALVDGSDAQNAQTTESLIRRLAAGSVSIEYVRAAFSDPTRFPTIVMELIGRWLAGSGGSFVGVATGVCGEADDDDFGFTNGI